MSDEIFIGEYLDPELLSFDPTFKGFPKKYLTGDENEQDESVQSVSEAIRK